MSYLMQKLTRPFKRFAKDTDASIAVEAALIIPLLAAWFVGSFVFFDAFKSRSTALKASYTIGDIVSRRTQDASVTYLNNLHRLYEQLANTSNSSALRVTMVNWDGDVHSVVWSYASVQSLRLKSNRAAQDIDFTRRMPIMSVGENVILVETLQDYNPIFNVGIQHTVWENFIVTAPRYASKLGYDPEGRAIIGNDDDFVEPVRKNGGDNGQSLERKEEAGEKKQSSLASFIKKVVAYAKKKLGSEDEEA